ncbi:ankyrin repeat and SOCS box protein 9-like [Lethenteron reissneri]|uniref:ankyrin repeat and SOCS box protein 9-like n=1 Tax=Lethenteron reissneri TaxID=7753 RepID=UPI002AB7546D|nr:ankyrin repeat and SOCS box protein 9-like [Lethenteron reissneri]XP_061431881.1 ankyrin repeat and SOCS box protein 9-like [Lethenteron reissneri]
MAGESPWGDSDLSAFWDYTPLHEAALHGHLLNLTHLLAQGASVNARTRGGMEPLHAACLGGHARCVEALLKGGARVDVVDVEGATPLLCAARAGSPPCVELLLGGGGLPQGPPPRLTLTPACRRSARPRGLRVAAAGRRRGSELERGGARPPTTPGV